MDFIIYILYSIICFIERNHIYKIKFLVNSSLWIKSAKWLRLDIFGPFFVINRAIFWETWNDSN